MSLPDLLPVIQALTDALVAAASREVTEKGYAISCGPGCGACCRQLVPIGEIEAVHLRNLLSGLDSSRRKQVEKRFEVATRRLSDAGLLEALRATDSLASREVRRELGLRYFRLGIPCPFLENESCSIHPHRPLSCREYLVISPATKCAQPDCREWETVELPRRPSSLLFRFGDGIGASRPRWLPLTLMLERDGSLGDLLAQRIDAGPLLFERFVRKLAEAKGEAMVSPESNQP